uniref:hypothetical protein n=1 Tax=uncultured Sphingomonas sp. TaxID=158754 RepID=UPI0025E962CA|nr:hypothetical protein [uncultured Sphingomonas sp.]
MPDNDDEAEQDALFQIEGPDEDGCVWACSNEGREVWCRNLGTAEKVAEVMSQWLGSYDDGERI